VVGLGRRISISMLEVCYSQKSGHFHLEFCLFSEDRNYENYFSIKLLPNMPSNMDDTFFSSMFKSSSLLRSIQNLLSLNLYFSYTILLFSFFSFHSYPIYLQLLILSKLTTKNPSSITSLFLVNLFQFALRQCTKVQPELFSFIWFLDFSLLQSEFYKQSMNLSDFRFFENFWLPESRISDYCVDHLSFSSPPFYFHLNSIPSSPSFLSLSPLFS
jgi:hypothetical protein